MTVTSNPKPEFVKIFLPGETPWARIIQCISDDRLIVSIDNDLVNTCVHGFSYGDEVVVCRVEDSDGWAPDGVTGQ